MASSGNFQRTLDRFKISLSPDEIEDFQFSSLADVHNVIDKVQEDQKLTKTMMNLPRIQCFLETMDQFGKVVEIFLNNSMFVSYVWVRASTVLHTL